MSDAVRGDATKRSTEDDADLGFRLREAREYLGLSQELVAEQLGVPRASISTMETGKRKVSSLELKKLAALYRRPITYFLGEEEVVQAEEQTDETFRTLFRATKSLNEEERRQVVRFAQFLRQAGKAPTPTGRPDGAL